ncbi:MAG: hypothetical protein KJ947_04170 [Alphaproteobacteria bacterium]|jgi:hypothetical protein|nr:hypothetical protein [Alphaproteobacteria bacterium]MBU1548759.1 hypothetical protein [Alphaproteobacteria bacterium]MBU2335585.1 hypothetical protein [Alphaproteobacteria bacterium]MBU2391020.1 hypothetical protein [Alphaproteobacteria bacterium]
MTRPVLAISIGDAADLEKLGFPLREVNRVLFAVCTSFIRAGYLISYAGDLRPEGFTHTLFEFLAGTYAGQGIIPFLYIVPSTVSNDLDFSRALGLARDTRSIATIRLVRGHKTFLMRNAEGTILIGERGAGRLTISDDLQWQAFLAAYPAPGDSQGLTDARRSTSIIADGCVSMGGRTGLLDLPTDQYRGGMPGVAEEALVFLRAKKPYVPLAAFGGATRDIAISLGYLHEHQRTPRGQQVAGYQDVMDEIKLHAAGVEHKLRALLMAVAKEENAEEAAQLSLAIIQAASLDSKTAPRA